MDEPLSSKRDALIALLSEMPAVVVAYSGGVDSTFLASVAHDVLGAKSLAVTARSPSLAQRDLEAAVDIARRFEWNHLVADTGELAREEYARNSSDRCYWCKTELLQVLGPIAARRGAIVLMGTNADDLDDYRPGIKAATEHGARAPMAEAGLTKAEIRELSAALGLPTADKPASPCLASRFAYGVRVTPEGLRRVERAEEIVRSFGFTELRVRDHGDLARIEVPAEQVQRVAELRDALEGALRELGFRFVTLDLTGFRSGSLNQVLPAPKIDDSFVI
jgi:pyridinium-3,5-biscarboxylic acid mononucleotide sulfurtransferase